MRIQIKKSNCLFEALKAKIKDPKNIVIKKQHGKLSFFWMDKRTKKYYAFFCKEELRWHNYLWHSGKIMRNYNILRYRDARKA